MRDHIMEPDDYTIDITTSTVDTYTVDTVDLSGITLTTSGSDYNVDWGNVILTDENRTTLRDSGQIPVDIWAKMYNNGTIDD